MKPQFDARRLDGRGASPHLTAMGKGDHDPKAAARTREAALAQALRANLRRRKVAGAQPDPPKTAPKPHPTSTD